MAILYDARGNEIRVGFPDGVTNETTTDPRPVSATLAAINAEVVVDLNGAAAAIFDVRTGAGSLTYLFEVSIDGVNYFSVPAFCQQQLLAAAIVQESFITTVVVGTTHSGLYVVGVTGVRRVRLRVLSYASGNIVVSARATSADFMIYARPLPSNLHITATGAANAIATATLPAPGLNMFHYITHISCMRNATAALAGTATLIHTTTNLPGNPAWSVGNAMIAGGTQVDVNYTPTTPLKSAVSNTATTVVMPAAGAAVLNRINVSYYTGY